MPHLCLGAGEEVRLLSVVVLGTRPGGRPGARGSPRGAAPATAADPAAVAAPTSWRTRLYGLLLLLLLGWPCGTVLRLASASRGGGERSRGDGMPARTLGGKPAAMLRWGRGSEGREWRVRVGCRRRRHRRYCVVPRVIFEAGRC